MKPFADELSTLVARHVRAAGPEEIADIVERLLHSAGFTIALAASGDRKHMNELLTGAESYLYEAAAQHQRIAEMLRGVTDAPRTH